MDSRIEKQLAFSLEIDKVKSIFRQTHLSDKGRNENDAEHSWHMAVMAYLLKEYANEEIDIAKVMLMCLIHDIVEIDAGDTYAYDAEGLKTQKAREDAAKERIFSILPEEQARELIAIFDEFEVNFPSLYHNKLQNSIKYHKKYELMIKSNLLPSLRNKLRNTRPKAAGQALKKNN